MFKGWEAHKDQRAGKPTQINGLGSPYRSRAGNPIKIERAGKPIKIKGLGSTKVLKGWEAHKDQRAGEPTQNLIGREEQTGSRAATFLKI